MNRRGADAALVFACFLWGISFVIVKRALDDATPLAFAALRFGIGAALLAPFAHLRRRFSARELGAGLLLAALLGFGFLFQTTGLVWTTPSRSAFIVAISSVLAPAMAALALRERPGWPLVTAVLLAALGTYWLTAPDAGGLNRGDVLTLATAVLFGVQIVATTALSRRYDPLRLVWLQIAGTAVLGAAGAALFEQASIHWTRQFVWSLAYTAVGPTVAALLLQMLAQRHMSSARAALLFCFETLFAAACSWLVIGERLSTEQWLGGGLILAGMVLAELKPSAVSYQPSATTER
ncbi:MAG TPA: DMT family transporter [Myxococcales bacterium]|nr:DMT family transporter [Gemmatimonadales bacterium]HYV65597.1 DMT family transporter [Myxococcales bacterium]